jgi:cell division protease FtsH
LIDEEVRKLIETSYDRTKQLLEDKKEQVIKLAEALLDKEVLFQSDVETLIGKRPYEEKKILDADEVVPAETGEISAGVPPYDSDVTKKALP